VADKEKSERVGGDCPKASLICELRALLSGWPGKTPTKAKTKSVPSRVGDI